MTASKLIRECRRLLLWNITWQRMRIYSKQISNTKIVLAAILFTIINFFALCY